MNKNNNYQNYQYYAQTNSNQNVQSQQFNNFNYGSSNFVNQPNIVSNNSFYEQRTSTPIINTKQFFTMKELIDLNVDFELTQKVFSGGQVWYAIKDVNVLQQINNGTWNPDLVNDNIDDERVYENNSEIYSNNQQYNVDNIQYDNNNDWASFDDNWGYENNNYNVDYNTEYNVVQNNEYDSSNNEYEYYNEYNDVSNNQEYQYESSLDDSVSSEYQNEYQDEYQNEYFDNSNIDQNSEPSYDDYYSENVNEENESSTNYEMMEYENDLPSKNVENLNKKLWRTEDILYKIYNISYNPNHENPNEGCLYNFSFNIYPGDRIAIMAHDSKSDTLILDILQNNVAKDSGYVFFNLKREQKWFDIYSNEYVGFDIEMYNRRYEAIYQFQSPDYLSYGKSKSDTILSTFKRIFNSVDYIINNQIFEDLLYLLDLEKDVDLPISKMNYHHKRRFCFICDVLIGKKILLMIDLTEGFDITKKISFYRYINSLFQDSDTIILFNVKDSFEVKLLANRLMIIDDGQMAVNKRISDILDKFETIDLFIIDIFDKLYKKYLREQ